MKNNDDIPTTDTTEIKRLINRVKQGELDQGDAQLIEKLLNILLTIVSLLQRKHTSIRRMKVVANVCFPVYRHLVQLSADGKLFHIDDTRVRILSCYREDKNRSEKERRATHTSGIVVKDEAGRKIALYFSGRRHAGENLDDVLERRSPSLPTPIKMSDAASVNGKKRLKRSTPTAWRTVEGSSRNSKRSSPSSADM